MHSLTHSRTYTQRLCFHALPKSNAKKHSDEMKMRMANHNSSFSFYPFNKMPSHQNVCTKDKSECAASFGFACRWCTCYKCARYTRQSRALYVLSLPLPRCMAINSSGRFRFSSYRSSQLLSLDVDIRSQTNQNFFIFIWLQKNIRLLRLLFFAFNVFAPYLCAAEYFGCSQVLRHICALKMQNTNTTTTNIIYLRNYSTN